MTRNNLCKKFLFCMRGKLNLMSEIVTAKTNSSKKKKTKFNAKEAAKRILLALGMTETEWEAKEKYNKEIENEICDKELPTI